MRACVRACVHACDHTFVDHQPSNYVTVVTLWHTLRVFQPVQAIRDSY